MAYKITNAKIWNGSQWTPAVGYGFKAESLVVAGGGAGGEGFRGQGSFAGGGGGAGGYRSSVSGESSGGGALAEDPIVLLSGETYSVVVGAGGPRKFEGSDSRFASIVSIGGGCGAGVEAGGTKNGGSGGGAAASSWAGAPQRGAGTEGQGFIGGTSVNYVGGGGGGASEAGNTDGQAHGGDGVASSITGSSVTRAGGGSGANGGTGGEGGGGSSNGQAGAANTGGGGAGANINGASGTGGSGIVIVKVPKTVDLVFSAGVTFTSAIVGLEKIFTITATSTTSETVTIA